MVVDTRTLAEREHGYPPNPGYPRSTLHRDDLRQPDEWLIDPDEP